MIGTIDAIALAVQTYLESMRPNTGNLLPLPWRWCLHVSASGVQPQSYWFCIDWKKNKRLRWNYILEYQHIVLIYVKHIWVLWQHINVSFYVYVHWDFYIAIAEKLKTRQGTRQGLLTNHSLSTEVWANTKLLPRESLSIAVLADSWFMVFVATCAGDLIKII